MKVIFLDIDGVLNSLPFIYECDSTGLSGIEFKAMQIDSVCVQRLNHAIETTGAKCVLSSAWRKIHPLDEMQEILEFKDFKGELIDKTPYLSIQGRDRRKKEIQQWLDKNEVDKYVVLDDEGKFEGMPFVKTNLMDCGMDDRHMQKVIQLLGEKDGTS